MKKIKLVTTLGTRPEIIRLSAVIKRCDKEFDHILVHTGQNYDYELNQIFFEELGIRKPDYYLSCVGKNLGETIGNIIAETYDLLIALKPDAILILGDTNSALAAISAKRLKIPIFHMEAGNRCGDWNVPETINRKIVDHISDINLPYTNIAKQNLINEGLEERYIFVTGSPMLEVIHSHLDAINRCDILKKMSLEKNKYIVVSSHREENIDNKNNFEKVIESINAVAEKYKIPIIFSTHPRTRHALNATKAKLNPLIISSKPFGFIEYAHLQKNAMFVLSDSGTLTEESAMMKFPAILFRTSTERPEGILAKSIVLSGIEKTGVLKAIERELSDYKFAKMPENYDKLNVSKIITKIIKENISFINKEIWHKND